MLTNQCNAFIGQSRLPNIVPFHMLYIVSSCAIVSLSFRRAVFFSIFHFKKCRDLEIRVRGPSRSLEILPLDTARMTSLCSKGYQLWWALVFWQTAIENLNVCVLSDTDCMFAFWQINYFFFCRHSASLAELQTQCSTRGRGDSNIRVVARNLTWGVYVLTSHCNFKT